jgi:GAF domain-containing protein
MGFDGEAIMPFVAVAVLLLLEWTITLIFPTFQRWLIYTKDQDRTQWIQRLGDRLLAPTDAEQLLESILAALCDQLRVPTAFVARVDFDTTELVQVVGSLAPSQEALTAPELSLLIRENGDPSSELHEKLMPAGDFFVWRSYWLTPLRYNQPIDNGTHPPLLGILGVWARAPEPDLTAEEIPIFSSLSRQAAQVLEDLQLQSEVFVALEGLASRMDAMQQLRGVSRYGHVSQLPAPSSDVLSKPDFSDLVRDALRDYWGGPKLTDSELLKLNIVWHEMESTDNNPARALRTVLAQAIENLKPEGQRSLTTSEWILYNILEMRFLQGRKVRDVALRLAMSESDLYRKQRVAIEEVARQIADMERNSLNDQQ